MMSNDDYKDREQMTGTYIVSDYMRPSLNKVRFLLNASDPKYYVNSFIPPRRNWENLLHPAVVADIVQRKLTPAYRNYEPVGEYRGKGFVANNGEIKNGVLLDTVSFDSLDMSKVSPDWLKTLNDVIDYCEKKNIRLVLFSAPMTLFQTVGIGNYSEYIALMNEIAESRGVKYVDFNLCREAWFDQTPDLFADAGHLNEKGAEAFQRVFGDYFNGKISKEDLFYDSMAEKLAAAEPRILGLSFLDSGDGMKKLKIVSTMAKGTAFEVTLVKSDGSETVVKDNSAETFFEIPQDMHGTLRITGAGQTVEIEV